MFNRGVDRVVCTGGFGRVVSEMKCRGAGFGDFLLSERDRCVVAEVDEAVSRSDGRMEIVDADSVWKKAVGANGDHDCDRSFVCSAFCPWAIGQGENGRRWWRFWGVGRSDGWWWNRFGRWRGGDRRIGFDHRSGFWGRAADKSEQTGQNEEPPGLCVEAHCKNRMARHGRRVEPREVTKRRSV